MATQTKQRSTDYGAERFTEIGERVLETGRKTGKVYLDAYERTANTVADFQERLAGASHHEWVASIAHAQADLTREVAKAQTSAARELLR
jgi:hypothetical protein